MDKGKLIVIEAGDGSGKATQTKKLFERLKAEGRKVRQVSFPNYDSPSSSLVKMYLNGDFGKHADDVDAYAASTFYAVDRYASFRMNWKAFYDAGEIILADRYVTSNMVHQAVKIADSQEREVFLDWLDDLEYVKLKLPRPDLVIFLDMPTEISERLIKERKRNDIHETDFDYLHRCYDSYKELAKKFNWSIIHCSSGDQPLTVETIHEEVFDILRRRI
ncbi:MAG: thymidylate kinase [Selenomonadaceae bacterium]|nr:thymidylate kinase [Selenomonadaceae bacterium]